MIQLILKYKKGIEIEKVEKTNVYCETLTEAMELVDNAKKTTPELEYEIKLSL